MVQMSKLFNCSAEQNYFLSLSYTKVAKRIFGSVGDYSASIFYKCILTVAAYAFKRNNIKVWSPSLDPLPR